MRDRLVELLCNVKCEGEECFGNCPHRIGQKCNKVQRLEMCSVFAIADHLLANGIIVPPCKMDQKVYVANNGGIREATVYEMYLRFNNDTEVLLSYECDLDCEKCPFSSWSQDPSGEYSCGGEYGCWGVKFEDFGKTVFLTREAAEKALAERREG